MTFPDHCTDRFPPHPSRLPLRGDRGGFWSPGANRSGARSAFTLLETMVVVVIIALLAAIIVPQFGSNEQREFKITVEQVADLLTMYAQREALEQRPVGISYDPGRHEIRLVVLDADLEAGVPVQWFLDPYVSPVRLPEHVDTPEVTADGNYVDIADWPLASTPHQQRPEIRVVLHGLDYTGTVRLPSHAIVPEVSGISNAGFNALDHVDLDSAGRSREDW